VIRIDGQLTDLKGHLGAILGAVGRLRGDMPWLSGIEIDHDCADSRLSDYADLLRRLKPRLDPSLRLSITALPTWISSPLLSSVLECVDEAILQVHAVRAPTAELFDPSAAMRWVDGFAKITPVPFRVSLPNYGVRVSRVESERYLIESESPLLASGSSPLELVADPGAVSQFVRDLGRLTPRKLSGIVWFRLPTVGDRRIWSRETWIAAIHGRFVARLPEIRTEPTGIEGISNIVLSNPSGQDMPLPQTIAFPQGCLPGDGVNGFELGGGTRLGANSRGMLRGGHRQIIGWARCQSNRSAIDAS
jgi:hypothetical protein